MKLAPLFAAVLVLCLALPAATGAKGKKPMKFCKGKDKQKYEIGKGYLDTKTCIQYTCVKIGKRLKMKGKKMSKPCTGPPTPSIPQQPSTSPPPSSGDRLEAIEKNIQDLKDMMTAVQSTSKKHEISINTNMEGIAANENTAEHLGTCLSDVTSTYCPASPEGKVSITEAIKENKEAIGEEEHGSGETCNSTILCHNIEGCPLVKNTLMTTLTKMPMEFFISFDYKATAYSSDYEKYNVIQFLEDGDNGGYGFLSVWIADGGTIYYNVLDSFLTSTVKYSVNQWHRVSFSHRLENGNYNYRVFINGSNVIENVNNDPIVFSNVKVYAANPWDNPVEGFIRNLYINTCEAPVDGEWGEWSEWSACSATCGTATKKRKRICFNPEPSNGGNPCSGDEEELEECSLKACG